MHKTPLESQLSIYGQRTVRAFGFWNWMDGISKRWRGGVWVSLFGKMPPKSSNLYHLENDRQLINLVLVTVNLYATKQ